MRDIKIEDLTEKDIGRWVLYHAHNGTERGRIKSFNDLWIFVVYNCGDDWENYKDYTAAATNPLDLEFKEQAK